jgi:hypothetical protein
LWFTLFDDVPEAAKVTRPEPRSGNGTWLAVDDGAIGPGRAEGTALDASWDLRFESGEPELLHLPARWMYGSPLPRTKPTSPHPEAVFTGTLRFRDREIHVDRWPGMVGHNWGAEHAERWIWMHGWFEPGTWLDVAIGRIRIGPWTTPWVANGALALGGTRHRIGGLGKIRSTDVNDDYASCRFALPGDPSVRGVVDRALEKTVVWPYADPAGGEHHSLNCSVAAMTIELDDRTLRTDHGAVYELGVRETDHGLPVQPFADG